MPPTMQYRYLSKWLESVVAIMNGVVKCAVNLIIPLIWLRVSNQSRYQIFSWNTLCFPIILWYSISMLFILFILRYFGYLKTFYFDNKILDIILIIYDISCKKFLYLFKMIIWAIPILHLYKSFYNRFS